MSEVLGGQRSLDDLQNLGEVRLDLSAYRHHQQPQGLEGRRALLLLLQTAKQVAHGVSQVLVWEGANFNWSKSRKVRIERNYRHPHTALEIVKRIIKWYKTSEWYNIYFFKNKHNFLSKY